MNRKVTDILLLLFLGVTSYLIVLYLVGIFYTPVRTLSNITGNDYWKAGFLMFVLAAIDFFIARRLFGRKK